jgi:hypothetical protein
MDGGISLFSKNLTFGLQYPACIKYGHPVGQRRLFPAGKVTFDKDTGCTRASNAGQRRFILRILDIISPFFMKALCFCLIFLCQIHFAYSQECTPDPTILEGEELFLPEFWTPENQVFNFTPACINQPYVQTLTIHIPATVFVPGFGDVDVNNLSIATTGGILGLPSGMTYSCNPPNCVFETETLSCIRLEGTPDISNEAPDTVSLSMLGILDIGLPVAITIPGTLEPGSMWPLILRTEEECINATEEDFATSMVQIAPNPFSSEANILLELADEGMYDLTICNLLGQPVFADAVWFEQGLNTFSLDTHALQTGWYTIAINHDQLHVIRYGLKVE